MEKVLFVLLASAVGIAVSEESIFTVNCTGKHEYRDTDGSCHMCEKCPLGQQPRGHCGYGTRVGNYGCETCPDGAYSLTNSYDICVLCRPCAKWHSAVDFACLPKRNSVCGRCNAGYYRPTKSDGKPDDECRLCTSATRNEEECMEKKDNSWPVDAKVVVAIVACVAFVATITAICCSPCCRRRRKRHQSNYSGNHRKMSDPEVSSGVGSASASDIGSQCLVDSRSDITLEGKSLISLASQENKPDHQPIVSHISEAGYQNKMEATRLPSMHSHYHPFDQSHQNYSAMPTAEFNDPPLEQSMANMPTLRYDDRINHNYSHVPNIAPPQSRHTPIQRLRPEITSSNENLLENVDSKTPETVFQPDSFDTSSCVSEATKPHKLYHSS